MSTYRFPNELGSHSSTPDGDPVNDESINARYTAGEGPIFPSVSETSMATSTIDDGLNAGFQYPQGMDINHNEVNTNGIATWANPFPDPYHGAAHVSPPDFQAVVTTSTAMPALDFNGFILYAAGRPVPKELMRVPTGTSIAEPGSIIDEESGRMYHNHHTGRYFFPNDPAEQDRLDLQHKLITLLLDRQLHHAPVKSPKNVLDVATGTGIWSISFAKMHPDANVVGTDLSLIQPDNAPPNVSFIKEDSEKDEWVFPEPFDFIFLRLVVTGFDDHRTVIKKAFDNLRPGGWIEFNDVLFELLCTDGTADGTHIQKWSELVLQAGDAIGRDFRAVKKYKQWLLEAGFVDVTEEIIPCPMNPWPSDPKFMDIGRWELLNSQKAIRGMTWKLFRTAMGMTPEEIENYVELVQTDFRDLSIHGFFPFYVVYGRKPYPEELSGGISGASSNV